MILIKHINKNQREVDPAYSQSSSIKRCLDGGSGGVVQWNPDGVSVPTTTGEHTNAIMDMAHELFHAADANEGKLDDRVENNLPRKEWKACYYENLLRQEMHVPLRTHYYKGVDNNGNYIEGTGPSLLRNGEPQKPSWL